MDKEAEIKKVTVTAVVESVGEKGAK